jgi:uncharacterized membrane protein
LGEFNGLTVFIIDGVAWVFTVHYSLVLEKKQSKLIFIDFNHLFLILIIVSVLLAFLAIFLVI